ncbi:MAG: hypothetical protein DCF15_17400, partial [Phormidesmis priestleyi]
MTQHVEFSEEFLTKVAKDNRVSDGELAALKLALDQQKSKDIAKYLNISEAAARKRLGEVYKKFDIKGNGPGKLASLKQQLVDSSTGLLYKAETKSGKAKAESAKTEKAYRANADEPLSSPLSSPLLTGDQNVHWNDAPTLNLFRGREQSLDNLAQWISQFSQFSQSAKSHKLLAICGIGGIGKSYLARKLAERVSEQFQVVVWVSVSATQSPEDFLRSLIPIIQSDHSSDHFIDADRLSTLSMSALIEQFLKCLSRQRCLIVLDGFERLFDSHQPDNSQKNQASIPTFDAKRRQQASSYRAGFEAYSEVLSAVIAPHKDVAGDSARDSAKSTGHTSCLILTSREKPRELLSVPVQHSNAWLYTLSGLRSADVKQLLESFEMAASPADYEAITDRYCGHPMALRISANIVKDVFDGSIADFLDQEISVFDDLRGVIKTQFKRLPPIEQEVMYWLVVNHQPCTLISLKKDIVSEDHKQNLLYTLQSLERRSLVEVRRSGGISFHLHPMVSEYVLNRFIRAIFSELMRGSLDLFNSHALMKADAEDELREFQKENIVEPVLERLKNHYKSLDSVDEQLSDRLSKFRQENYHRLGYAGGNFVNLLVQLSQGQRLSSKDFSKMTIWQAYLQGVELRDVNFNRCQLDRSVFTETLSDVLTLAFQDSFRQPLLACGDANGSVHLWEMPLSLPATSRSPSGQSSDQLENSPSAPSSPLSAAIAGANAQGQKYAEWEAHSGWVRAIAFIPKRSLLVTGGDDSRLKLWRLPTAQCALAQPEQLWQRPAEDWIHAVAVSPNGKIIASGSGDKITLHHVRNGQEICQLGNRTDGQTDDQIYGNSHISHGVWDKAPQSMQRAMQGTVQQNRIRTLAFSADSNWLASCSDDHVICLWPLKSLTLLMSGKENLSNLSISPMWLKGHKGLVHSMCFSPDSALLISGSEDKTVRVWAVASGECQQTLRRPNDRVRSVAISADGRFLATGGDDCRVTLWDLKTLNLLNSISTQSSRIWSVAFHQQGERLTLAAGGDKQTLMLWQVCSNQRQRSRDGKDKSAYLRRLRTYRGYTNGIRAVAFLGDRRITGGGDSGDLSVWDTETHNRKATLSLHHGRIWAIAVDLQNARVASGSDDHTVRLWDANTGQCLTTLTGHNNWVRTVAFSSRGRFLASGGDDGTIRIWNTASGFCLKILEQQILEQPVHWIRSLSFNPKNNRYLISGGDNCCVQRWNRKEASVKTLFQHQRRVCSVAYSPDGRMIASGSDDATVILWDVEKNEIYRQLEPSELGIKALAFSPNGHYLAAGGEDQLVYVWDLRAENLENHCFTFRPEDYRGIAGGIRSVGFSPDSQFVISGGA